MAINTSVSDQEWTQNPSQSGVYVPGARRWEDLIEETYLIDQTRFMSGRYSKEREHAIGGAFCRLFCTFDRQHRGPFSFHRTYHAEVILRSEVWQLVLQATNFMGHDRDIRYSVKAIEWPDGRALVAVGVNLILSSYWLGFVDPATLPDSMAKETHGHGR